MLSRLMPLIGFAAPVAGQLRGNSEQGSRVLPYAHDIGIAAWDGQGPQADAVGKPGWTSVPDMVTHQSDGVLHVNLPGPYPDWALARSSPPLPMREGDSLRRWALHPDARSYPVSTRLKLVDPPLPMREGDSLRPIQPWLGSLQS